MTGAQKLDASETTWIEKHDHEHGEDDDELDDDDNDDSGYDPDSILVQFTADAGQRLR